jgi:hypothetical protein
VIQEGQPIGLFYGFKTDGLWKSQKDIDYHESLNPDYEYQTAHNSTVISPGDIKYVDVTGDGYVNRGWGQDEDKTVLGDPNPDFTGGFSSSLRYKNLTLSMQGTYSYGGKKAWSGLSHQFSFQSFDPVNLLDVAMKRWTPENPDGFYPQIKMDHLDDSFNDYYIFDASYVKIQNVQLDYRLPSSLLKKTNFIHRANIYFAVNNVHTFTKYPGPNPDAFSDNSVIGSTAMDEANYPNARSFKFGIKVTLK